MSISKANTLHPSPHFPSLLSFQPHFHLYITSQWPCFPGPSPSGFSSACAGQGHITSSCLTITLYGSPACNLVVCLLLLFCSHRLCFLPSRGVWVLQPCPLLPNHHPPTSHSGPLLPAMLPVLPISLGTQLDPVYWLSLHVGRAT